MNLKDQLRENATNIDKALKDFLLSYPSPSEKLRDAMIYGAIGSGKKIRPWLVMESARILKADPVNAQQCAMAVECIHAYSLIHDDLPSMDDDDLRRGKPTTHIIFDEATAILAGDSLLTIAFDILADEKTHPDPKIRIQLVSELAQASGASGMVAGQMLDLSAARNSFDLQQTNQMQGLKTGRLIEFSCAAGAILTSSKTETVDLFKEYGAAIGLAFQITDDLLDAEGCEQKTGKRAGKDKEKGKSTYIDFLGVEGARDKARHLVERAKETLKPFADEAEGLRKIADHILTRDN